MKRITWESCSSEFSPLKQPQFLSQRPSIDNVSRTLNNSLLNKSGDLLNTSLNYQDNNSLHQSSSNRRTGGIPWGVTPKENRFDTTYSTNYGIYNKTRSVSKLQDTFSPPHSLSDTLIPFDLRSQKRISKVGEFNASVQRRVQTEGETFFDKVGERPQQPLKRGLLKIDERRPVDHALRNEHRFYRQIESDHGVSTRKLSPSRVVKNILDYSPPADLSGGAGSVTRNNESLAFSRDLSPGYKELIGKVGVSYSTVLSRVKENKQRASRFSPKKPADYDMKSLLSNSFVDSREMSPAQIEPKPSRKGRGQHNYERPTFSSFYCGRGNFLVQISRENQKLNQSYDFSNHKRSNSSDRLLLQKERVINVFDVNKIKVEEKRDGRSRSSHSNQSIQNKLTNNTSLMSWMSVIKERSRSNSTQSLKEALKGTGVKRSSVTKQPPVVEKSAASPEKHVSTVVIHEKKKPIRGGMFGNPIINKNFVKKMLDKSTKQQRSLTPPKWK